MHQHTLLNQAYIDLALKPAKDIAAIKQVHAGILEHIDSTYYPFLIIADALPTVQAMEACLAKLLHKGLACCDIMLVMVGQADAASAGAWEIMQTGIKDIYYWVGEDDFRDYILHTIQRKQKVCAILESALVKDNLVGESLVWKKFLSEVIETALFSQCSFLLMGDSGTGKELISRLIHTIDNRPDKKELVLVDCTTIVPELSGSEFFGHERGSYTNALQSREGAFSLANKGTLFLDEIGELPLPLQAGLLRVIQEGTYKKVGSNTWQKTNFRLVCATHRNLRTQVEENKFRQDLFYRISDVEFHVPSLQERKEDIPLLANFFLRQFCPGKDCAEFDSSILDFLTQRAYPGNVRELRQLVQRIALRHVRHKQISIGELPVEERLQVLPPSEPFELGSLEGIVRQMILNNEKYNTIKDKTEFAAIEAAIEMSGGNKQKAAEKLGINVRTVQLGIKKRG